MIKRWRAVAGPPTVVSWERRECVSANGEWTAIFHSPEEWHMGADGWQLQLLHNGRDVTNDHRRLQALAGGKGFRCDSDGLCWSYDSKVFVFLTWDDEPVHLYEMSTRTVRKVATGASWVYSARWSPATDRLLITTGTGALLVDQNAAARGGVVWTVAPYEVFYTYWLKAGGSFFLVARESAAAKVAITFYSGDDGKRLSSQILDPAELVPYDARQFAAVPRDEYSLVMSRSSRGVGSLLDTWHDARFDAESATLYLAVCRPVSGVYKHEGDTRCDVETQWVAVELDA